MTTDARAALMPLPDDQVQTLRERDAEVPVADLISGIASDASQMFRLEVEAAKTDIKREVAEAKRVVIFGAAGALSGYLALVFGLLALSFGLMAAGVPLWLSFTGVTFLLAVTALVCAGRARKAAEDIEMPPQALKDAKKDLLWMKDKVSA